MILIYFGFFACGTEENPLFYENLNSSSALEEENLIWVCYNPASHRHGQECKEDLEKEECLVPGDQGKFCWSMKMNECNSSRDLLYNEICNKYKK